MKKKRNIVIIIIFIAGISLMLYPFLGHIFTYTNQLSTINNYNKAVDSLSDKQIKDALDKAEKHNKSLANDNKLIDPFAENKNNSNDNKNNKNTGYYDALSLKDKTIGHIEIPSINVNLPIFDNIGKLALQKGVGHLKDTALPIGGKSTHCVLTGHSALPVASIFTNLEKVKVDDYFYIHVLDKTLGYKIDQIKIVEPHEVSDLKVIENGDYVTLITCTPYSINTHRLLVRGVRDDSRINDPDPSVRSSSNTKPNSLLSMMLKNKFLLYSFIGIIVVIVLIIIIIIVKRKRKKRGIKVNEKEK